MIGEAELMEWVPVLILVALATVGRWVRRRQLERIREEYRRGMDGG